MIKAKQTPPGKGKGHFNIIDIVIIILILLVVAIAAFVFIYSGQGASGNSDAFTIEYQLWYDRQRPELIDRIKTGDKVYDWSGEYPLGEVVAVDVRPTVVDSYDKTSEQVVGVVHPERYSVFVTVRVVASQKDEAFYVGPVRVVVGSRINTRYPDFKSTASCVNVSKVESDG